MVWWGEEGAVRDRVSSVEPRFNLVDRTAAPLPYKILMHGSEAEHKRKRVLILLDFTRRKRNPISD